MRLYLINIASCIGSILLCAASAYFIGYIVGAVFYQDALAFRMHGGSIETSKLEQFDAMRSTLIWLGCAVGLVGYQSVFLVTHLRPRQEAA